MISGDIKAAGAGEDNRDIINARNIRSNNAAANIAYLVGACQIDGVGTISHKLDSIDAAGDGGIFKGEGFGVFIVGVVALTFAEGGFLADDGLFAGDEDIRGSLEGGDGSLCDVDIPGCGT